MDWIVKLGAWGAGGLIVGVIVVTLLGEGLETPGVLFITGLCIAAGVVLGGLVRHFGGGGAGGGGEG